MAMGRGLNALMAGLGVDVTAAEEEGLRRRVNRMMLQDAERKLQSQNALRGLAQESYNPGSPAVAPTPGTPAAHMAPEGQWPITGNALMSGGPESTMLMNPATPGTPGSPAVPESFDRGGFKRKAVGQGLDLDQINNFLAGMDESEKKAFKAEMDDLGNAATWVLYGGNEQSIMPRYKAAIQYLKRAGKDTTKFEGLQTPEEVGGALAPFIDQVNQIKMSMAKEVSSRQIMKAKAGGGKGTGTKTKTVQVAEWMIKNLGASPEEAFQFATEFESRGKFNRKAATVQLKNSSFMSDDEIEAFLDFTERLSPSEIPGRKADKGKTETPAAAAVKKVPKNKVKFLD
jgi:hypothetical protein